MTVVTALLLATTLLPAATRETADQSGAPPALSGFGHERIPAPPWELDLLPNQKLPKTEFNNVETDGRRALALRAVSSFGNLTHLFPPPGVAGQLSWEWTVVQFANGANLRRKDGDDNAIKVCALFDLPIEDIPFWDRLILKRARGRAKRHLPAATVCYTWDPALPSGTRLNNPFSKRLRYLVLRSGAHEPGWLGESRDLARDFLDLFPDESRGVVPPLLGISVGADSDNTRGESLALIRELTHGPRR